MHDSVLYFAVTVRDGAFHPVFKGYNPITLGVSRFSNISNVSGGPQYVVACSFEGAKFSYYETHYYGGAADYQDFGFGVNPAGYIAPDSSGLSNLSEFEQKGYCPISSNQVLTPDLNVLENLRSNTVINTYAVSTDLIKNLNMSLYLGVDYDRVHLLN